MPQPNTPVTPCNTGTAAGVSPDSTRAGLATVCASSTDGTNTVFAKIALFFSGSGAVNAYRDGDPMALSTLVANDLGTVRSDESKLFTLQLNDVNLNPCRSAPTSRWRASRT